MTKTVEFYFDVGSPTSYLAWTQLPGIAREASATLVLRPVLLGGVFQATGNGSPVAIPAKGRWMLDDLARWARRYGVPLQFNPHFPVNTLQLMRAITGMQGTQPARLDAFTDAIFRGMWVERLNLAEPAVLAPFLERTGYDPAEVAALASAPPTKEALKSQTEAAVARGLFGAPTMFVGEEMFFGQDRLSFVREALAA